MPGHPDTSSSVRSMGGSVYSSLGERLRSYPGQVYPLHIGDTWMPPAEACRMEGYRVDEHPGLHLYTPPPGLPELRAAVADRVRARMGVPTGPANVLVSAGATGGLSCALGAIVNPGDEVLILAPHWPLVAGSTRLFQGVPVAVPFIGSVDSVETALAQVERYRTARTVAIYVNTPNNPTGRVIPDSWLHALADWAAQHGLWVLSDEVYEYCDFGGAHTYLRSIAPDRTLSVHSCSKAYGMSGLRVGYVVGPEAVMPELTKVNTYTAYCAPRPSQLAAIHAVGEAGETWATNAAIQYRALGYMAADTLGVPRPEGSTFLFLDVAEYLDERGVLGFLERCADRGLFLAPGASFGPYPTHVRVCFTSAPPEVVRGGIRVLADLLS